MIHIVGHTLYPTKASCICMHHECMLCVYYVCWTFKTVSCESNMSRMPWEMQRRKLSRMNLRSKAIDALSATVSRLTKFFEIQPMNNIAMNNSEHFDTVKLLLVFWANTHEQYNPESMHRSLATGSALSVQKNLVCQWTGSVRPFATESDHAPTTTSLYDESNIDEYESRRINLLNNTSTIDRATILKQSYNEYVLTRAKLHSPMRNAKRPNRYMTENWQDSEKWAG